MLSPAIENFLKAVYKLSLGSDEGWVSNADLARELDNSAAAITNMVKKLSASDKPLVEYKPYAGARLSQAGLLSALEVVRHHRLIELYLCKALDVPWDQVHEEAEKLEHHISEDLEARMAAALGNPMFDPHGAPIPTLDGQVFLRESRCLDDVEPGSTVEIVEVSDHDSELLRYLGDHGLYPHTVLKVISREQFSNALIVKVDQNEMHLGENATRYIRVA
jgi:DtxR family Mn-dependent transcriptional regulator